MSLKRGSTGGGGERERERGGGVLSYRIEIIHAKGVVASDLHPHVVVILQGVVVAVHDVVVVTVVVKKVSISPHVPAAAKAKRNGKPVMGF